MKFKLFFISFLLFLDIVFTSRKAANFVSEIVAQRSDIPRYKKIFRSSYFGLFGQNSRTQCSEVCLNEDSCESFYMDGGACVFGLNSGFPAFDEGEPADPDGQQRIQAKSKS